MKIFMKTCMHVFIYLHIRFDFNAFGLVNGIPFPIEN